LLVAEKQYLESYRPGAPSANKKIKVVERPEHKAKPNAKVKRKNKIAPVAMVLIGFVLSSLTVSRYVMIAQNHSDILKLERELEEEYKKEQRLRLELSYCEDLKRIEEYAKNNLDMDYPDESQVLYVQLPEQDLKQTKEKSTDESVEVAHQDQDKGTIWDKIASLLD